MPYVKQNFVNGNVLNASQLNHIEDGIVANEKNIIVGTGAGFHNSIYRGKNLGTSYTTAQQNAVKNGTFDDMYIGDYWVIGGTNWVIAHFDYYYNIGNPSLKTHHIVVVPGNNFYNYAMNTTATVAGAYYGSDLRENGLNTWKTRFDTAFGNAHRLSNRVYFITVVDSTGVATAAAWQDSDGCELMTEINVYGCNIRNKNFNYSTIETRQYSLFNLSPTSATVGTYYWFQDIATSSAFANYGYYGSAFTNTASSAIPVRPRFLLS